MSRDMYYSSHLQAVSINGSKVVGLVGRSIAIGPRTRQHKNTVTQCL